MLEFWMLYTYDSTSILICFLVEVCSMFVYSRKFGEGVPGKPVFGSNNAREFGGRGRIKEREWLALLVGLPGFGFAVDVRYGLFFL
jgi:hypothetical protein